MYLSEDTAAIPIHRPGNCTASAAVPLLPQAAQSPSLRADCKNACEMKFLVSEPLAQAIEASMRGALALDPHVDAALDNSYQLTTLYCDTAGYDVYYRVGRYRLFKYRIRRYGNAPLVYLERKSKRGYHVRKRRSMVSLTDLARLDKSASSVGQWGWYQRQLRRNGLAPVCLLHYRRRAYFGMGAEGPLRVTYDCDIRGALSNDFSLQEPSGMQALLPGQVVVEFKYQQCLPSLFKQVMQALQLSPVDASKYRRCLEVAGALPEKSHS